MKQQQAHDKQLSACIEKIKWHLDCISGNKRKIIKIKNKEKITYYVCGKKASIQNHNMQPEKQWKGT